MNRNTHAVYIFYPSTMTFSRTPFEGDREEMLAVAEELQASALQSEEKGMYVVRPLKPEDEDTSG